MPEFGESQVAWLDLPAREYAQYTCMSLQYGAGKVGGEYCGLRHVPTTIRGHWQHGWIPEHMVSDHRYVINEPGLRPGWVARSDEEEYLRAQGYPAKAIGLPIAYVPDRPYKRRTGSLLVMPAHSLTFTTHKWRFAEYAEAIASIRSEFSSVIVCVHRACLQNGYWISDFKKLGIPIVFGADVCDLWSLVRIKALMRQCEFVTTNAVGSCIAYACAFGAKVSLYGPYSESKAEDYAGDEFYRNNPGLLDKVLPLLSEKCSRAHWPDLFTHPAEAVTRTEWGLRQIGFSNRISPRAMKEAFDWSDWRHYTKRAPRIVAAIARRVVPQNVRRQVNRAMGR